MVPKTIDTTVDTFTGGAKRMPRGITPRHSTA